MALPGMEATDRHWGGEMNRDWPGWRVRCEVFAWALVVMVLAMEVRALPTVEYREKLKLEWGKVTFVDRGVQVTEETWYVRLMPTFSEGAIFGEVERECLTQHFAVCEGRLGSVKVWRISDDILDTGESSFRVMAGSGGCGFQNLRGFRPVPERGRERSLEWVLRFVFERAAPMAPPSVEVALLVPGVPAGKAWEVSIAGSVSDPGVRKYSGLSEREGERLVENQGWVRMFLVAPPLLPPPHFPVVEPLSDMRGYEAVVGLGLRTLMEVVEECAVDRKQTLAKIKALVRRFNVQSVDSGWKGYRWFPEADGVRRSLGQAEISTGVKVGELVRVLTTEKPDEVERVLPERNEWVIRLGPFVKLDSSKVRAGWVKGKTNDFPVAELPQKIRDPNVLKKWQDDLEEYDRALTKKLESQMDLGGRYFFLDECVGPHGEVVRMLERYPKVGGVRASFETNRFRYETIYRLRSYAGKVGATYNGEHGLGTELELEMNDVPRPGDVLSAKGSVAQHLILGTFRYQSPYWRSLDRKTKLQWELVGEGLREDRFRLGGLSGEALDYRRQSAGLQHQWLHRAAGWEVTVTDALLWDREEVASGLVGGFGEDAGLLLRDKQVWKWMPEVREDARRRWEYVLVPMWTVGPGVGWEDGFVMGQWEGGVRLGFGGKRLDGMSVGLRGGMGESWGGTPVTMLYRLGDGNHLLGLEPGERSGKSMTFAELSYGVNLEPWLGRLFSPKKGGVSGGGEEEDEGEGEEVEVPGVLAGLGVQVMAEVGSVARGKNGGSIVDPDAVVSSYGVALEKRDPAMGGAGFRLGYAWSPDSIRRSGRFFAAMSWSF